jgi:hypothetical protein
MRHLIKNFILVALSYSLSLSTPAAAKPSGSDNFIVVKNYVNSPGKKTFKGAFEKMEKDLPSNFYEQNIKKLKGDNGKMWFQAAKLADNYSYFRINNSKIFIRTTSEKGKTVFYANGVRIDDADLSGKDFRLAELKLFTAYAKGTAKNKSALLDFLKSVSARASTKFEPVPETSKGSAVDVTPTDDRNCELIKKQFEDAKAQAKTAEELAYLQDMSNQNQSCGLVMGPVSGGAATASQGKANIWIILAMLAAFLLLISKKKKKKASETPETECGVGRGISPNDGKCVPRPTPTPEPGHVNCGGDGAQCGGSETTTPGNPTSPPTSGTVSDDPNYYGESSTTSGRSATSVPVLKSKTKK